MRRLPGEPLGKAERFGDKRGEFGFKYGVGIAKLHRALKETEAAVMPNEVNFYKQAIEWALPSVRIQNERYDSLNPLTPEEKQSVFYVICAIQMICAAWFEKQKVDVFKRLANTNREMLTFIVESKSQIV